MKKEYDFSKGERGKFYHPDAKFHIPIYLDPDLTDFIQLVATKKGLDMNQLVNEWLRSNLKFIQKFVEFPHGVTK
jgi:hypothetical protein